MKVDNGEGARGIDLKVAEATQKEGGKWVFRVIVFDCHSDHFGRGEGDK